MIGAGAQHDVPVLVSIPQLVGGGAVGLAIGDAISITRRARLVAGTLASAEVIVESAIALSQEIHDGPYETYTGHGIWSAWESEFSYSLEARRSFASIWTRISKGHGCRSASPRRSRSGQPRIAQNQDYRHPLPNGDVRLRPT